MINDWQTPAYGAWTSVRAAPDLLMAGNWQTPAALAVVALTILLFLLKKKSPKSCGSNCECPKSDASPKK